MRDLLPLLVLIGVTSSSYAGLSTSATIVEIKPRVEVSSAQVTLDDIAIIKTTDMTTIQRLMSVPLGRAPRIGAPVVLSREELARWVARQTGLRTGEITWEGAEITEILTVGREIAGEDIARFARNQLMARLATSGDKPDIQIVSTPNNISVPRGELELRVRPQEAASVRHRMPVWVEVFVDRRFIKAVAVGFEISLTGNAVVTTRPLPAGKLLTTDDLTLRPVDFSMLSSDAEWLRDADRLLGMRLKRPLAAGQLVASRLVEPAPAVTKGQWVAAQSRNGAVTLTTRAEMLQDGVSGQIVRAKLANTVGTVMTKVMGPGMVEVQQ